MTGKKTPRFFYGYTVVTACCAVNLLAWGANRSFGVFLEPMIEEFGWTRAMASGAYTLSTVLMGLLAITAGRLTDRLGPRVIVTACGFFLGLGYLLMSRISTIWHLYLFFGVVIAIGLSASFVPLMTTVARWFVKRRGLMTGILAAGPGLGIAVIPLATSWLISTHGWRTSYIVLGGVILLLIILAAQFLRRDPAQMGLLPYGAEEEQSAGSNLSAEGFSFHEAFHTRQLWILAGIYFGSSFAVNVMTVHIVIYATGTGIPPITAASILTVAASLSIVGKIVSGVLADRIGTKRAIIFGSVLALLAFIFLLTSKELWAFYAFAAIFGLGGWAIMPMTSVMAAELFGTLAHGAIFGTIMSVGVMGGAIGPLIAGYIYDTTESYQLAFVGCTGVSAMIIILAWMLRPTGSKSEGLSQRRLN